MVNHSTLALIDRARGRAGRPFATDPNADELEHLARELTDAYWSELAWLTGVVSPHAFAAVCERLERFRQPLAWAGAD